MACYELEPYGAGLCHGESAVGVHLLVGGIQTVKLCLPSVVQVAKSCCHSVVIVLEDGSVGKIAVLWLWEPSEAAENDVVDSCQVGGGFAEMNVCPENRLCSDGAGRIAIFNRVCLKIHRQDTRRTVSWKT